MGTALLTYGTRMFHKTIISPRAIFPMVGWISVEMETYIGEVTRRDMFLSKDISR